MNKDYRPEALINFLALMGWKPATEAERPDHSEIFSLKDLQDLFMLNKISASNSKLDDKMLIYLNSHYLRKHYEDVDYRTKPKVQEFKEKIAKHLPDCTAEILAYPEERMKEMIKVVIERIKLYDDVKEFIYYFKPPDFKADKSLKSRQKVMHDPTKVVQVLTALKNIFKEIPEQEFKYEILGKFCGEYHFKNKGTLKHEDIYHLLRFVLTGNHSGGPALKTAEILGKEETLKRIEFWL
jgi:nondiscriminating glutamyl-tRNA synthetase